MRHWLFLVYAEVGFLSKRQRPAQLSADVGERQPSGPRLGNDQDILAGSKVGPVTAKKFAQLSFDPVSHHRIAKAAGGCNPQTGAAGVSRSRDHHEVRSVLTPTLTLQG